MKVIIDRIENEYDNSKELLKIINEEKKLDYDSNKS